MDSLSATFAYMAPELILPVASAVVGAVGLILLVGRAPFRLVAKGFGYVARWLPARRPPRSRSGG
jgi:hypothetical protein